MTNDPAVMAAQQMDSVIELAQDLIRHPSRGGIDAYGPVLGVLERWLTARSLPHRRLTDEGGQLVGLLIEIPGGRPGPWWALDACLDTAAHGDEASWSFSPTAGDVVDGWLRGRGSADSKLAAAAYCHIVAELHQRADSFAGGLAVLLDVDEHTGKFGGARAYLADPDAVRPAGVMIGYPGMDEVVVGGRGLWRAAISVHAPSGHSGSSRTHLNAITRAIRLVQLLEDGGLPTGAESGFPLPPKLTVTSIHSGEGFSTVPDLCKLNVDVRTVPTFGGEAAEALVRKAVAELDDELPAPKLTTITEVACWPPFQLQPDEEPAASLLASARAHGVGVRSKVAGPSNIGNLLAGFGIPATAGFGVPYEGLHGLDERAHLAELPIVYAVYRQAVLDLLHAS
ncbi:M20 family metallopeptidase [Streptomyces goshikiensis]|uniref:M20 family metallopeptidase n=1 Tax=Streptomyces goshikiensis TaxID=1942 RepID=UPI0037B5B39E